MKIGALVMGSVTYEEEEEDEMLDWITGRGTAAVEVVVEDRESSGVEVRGGGGCWPKRADWKSGLRSLGTRDDGGAGGGRGGRFVGFAVSCGGLGRVRSCGERELDIAGMKDLRVSILTAVCVPTDASF